jgi:hypothetical protein
MPSSAAEIAARCPHGAVGRDSNRPPKHGRRIRGGPCRGGNIPQLPRGCRRCRRNRRRPNERREAGGRLQEQCAGGGVRAVEAATIRPPSCERCHRGEPSLLSGGNYTKFSRRGHGVERQHWVAGVTRVLPLPDTSGNAGCGRSCRR